MKTELLSLLDNLGEQLAGIRAQVVSSFPEDPPAPANFAFGAIYGTDPVTVNVQWDAFADCQAILEYRGAPGNPNGPTDWTGISVTPGALTAGIVLPAGTNQVLFRVRYMRNADGAQGANANLTYPPTP